MDLRTFDISDTVLCADAIRSLNSGAETLPQIGSKLARFFYDAFPGQFALSRVFCTVSKSSLHAADFENLPTDSRYVRLVGTAGERPEWNQVEASRRHKQVELKNAESVRATPMFAYLFDQLNVDLDAQQWQDASSSIQTHLFFIEDAADSPFIQDQEQFVKPYGIKSVIGFGVTLPGGDIAMVLLFAKVSIDSKTADAFRALAVSVKLALLPCLRRQSLAVAADERLRDGQDGRAFAVIQAENAALRELLVLNESTFASRAVALEKAILAEEKANIQSTKDRLKLMEQKQNLMSYLAHDLKNPVVGMARVLEGLLANSIGEVSGPQREVITKLANSNAAMLRMINNVLVAYKGQDEFDYSERIDLRHVIAQATEQLWAFSQEKKIQISIDFSTGSLLVRGNTMLLESVLVNLIGNAIKFGKVNGNVLVRLKRTMHSVQLAVIDDGVGIESESLPRLFDQFYQTDKGFRRQGIGLGLFLCRSIIEKHGGTIICRSEPGVGTQFLIELPAVTDGNQTQKMVKRTLPKTV